MLTNVSTTTRRSPFLLLLSGVLTILGYLGKPWWVGIPAMETLALAERVFAVSERGAAIQLVAFFIAVVVNVLVWLFVLSVLSRAFRRHVHS